jgi:hypothetical protein
MEKLQGSSNYAHGKLHASLSVKDSAHSHQTEPKKTGHDGT